MKLYTFPVGRSNTVQLARLARPKNPLTSPVIAWSFDDIFTRIILHEVKKALLRVTKIIIIFRLCSENFVRAVDQKLINYFEWPKVKMSGKQILSSV